MIVRPFHVLLAMGSLASTPVASADAAPQPAAPRPTVPPRRRRPLETAMIATPTFTPSTSI